jgi:hypothetical protein
MNDDKANMTPISQYLDLVQQGAGFHDPRLAQIRKGMSKMVSAPLGARGVRESRRDSNHRASLREFMWKGR